jgi:hypothetical protein
VHSDQQDSRVLAAAFARGGYLGLDGHLCARCHVSQAAVF